MHRYWGIEMKKLTALLWLICAVAYGQTLQPPTIVTTPGSTSASLAWDDTANPAGTMYRVYHRIGSAVYVKDCTTTDTDNCKSSGTAKTFLWTSLSNASHYWVVTGYDVSGNESGYSNEVGLTVPISGAQGPKGDPGPAGPQGIQGVAGPAGATGARGATGATGPQGAAGAKGATGNTGATGPQGPIGLTGPAGAASTVPGPMGPQGPAGAKGDTGSQGPQGVQGIAGAKGDKGDPGNIGPIGPQGLPGLNGAQGPIGPTGPQGATGPQGIQGIPGSSSIPDMIIQVSATGTSDATISWTTNSECSGIAFYGTNANSLAQIVANNLGTTDHLVRVLGLTPRTHYLYKVRSICGTQTLESTIRSFNTK
jgi:hypothetical protein